MKIFDCAVCIEEPGNICQGCETQTVNTKFHPCNHIVLCLACSCQTRICPKCQREIDRVDYRNSNDGTGVSMMHRTLRLHRRSVETRDISLYPQILFVGDIRSDKHVIVQTIFQECSVRKHEEYIPQQLPIQRPFRPNADVDGRFCRISVLDGVGWKDGEHMLNCVQTLHPDVVVVCVSVARKNKLPEFINWSKALCRVSGIEICWLLAPDKLEGIGNVSSRDSFQKHLFESPECSGMLEENYFSMVGGMASVTPLTLARTLLSNAKTVRNDVEQQSTWSEISSFYDEALSEF